MAGPTNILPLAEIINVTISETPQGLTEPNVNSLAIFTNEAPINPATYGAFGVFVSASAVASAFGTNSVTAQMANAVFSQVPNILSGDGQLVIIPLLSSVSATAGTFTTANIVANISAFAAVTNGYIKVTVNSVVYDLINLNFTGITTLAQIAQILQNALPAGVTVAANATELVFTSDKVGSASTVVVAQYSGGTGTDLSTSGLLDTAGGTSSTPANSSGETISAAVTRTSGLVGYCPIMSNLNLEDAAIEANAAALQALDILYFQHFTSLTDVAGAITTIQQATETQTRCLLYTSGGQTTLSTQANANLMKAAYAGRACSVDFTGSNTDSTMNLKTLATIGPDQGISQTVYSTLNAAGADVYVSYAGVPAVYSTGGNDYWDNQYANKALKFALETAAFNYLAQTNTKVPQTEPGMTGFKSALIAVMQQFVRNGELAPGTWDSSETFGDPQIFNNNIQQNGYYVYSEPVALQSSSARNLRQAPLVQIAAKRAGALQSANILVVLNA
jgi:Protein of unknown function (DUF3383)